MRLAHGPLAQVVHNVPLHLLNVVLEVCVVLGVLRGLAAVVPHPDPDDGGGDGDGEDEKHPQLVGDDGVGVYISRAVG